MTHYDVLEVSENASQEVIQMAYKALVKKYHPDVNKGFAEEAEQLLKLINEAYETLSDPEKRKEYDAFLYISRHEEIKEEKREKNNDNDNEKDTNAKTSKRFNIVLAVLIGILAIVIIWSLTGKDTQAEAYYNVVMQNQSDLYALYDIDKDGVTELMIAEGEQAKATEIYFYTWENNEIVDLGGFEFSGEGTQIFKPKNENATDLYYSILYSDNEQDWGCISKFMRSVKTTHLYSQKPSEINGLDDLKTAIERIQREGTVKENLGIGDTLFFMLCDSPNFSLKYIEEHL